MGTDYSPPSVGHQTAEQLKALGKYGPGTYNAINAALMAAAPGQAAQDYQLYNQYATPYFQAGENLSDIGAQRGVARDISTINNGGAQLAQTATALDRAANPEFYANRAVAGKGFQDLIGGQDPNKLSGAELANVERGVNRMNYSGGNPASVGDATTTAANAMQFGDALTAKRAAFGQSLSLFPGIQQGSQSGINAYQIAAGRGANAGTNASLGQYQGPQQLNANQFYNQQAQNIGGIGQTEQQVKAGRRNIADYSNQAVGSVCCFIFMESYNGRLPMSVRLCRDFYYQRDPMVARGYKRMARYLVPAMRQSHIVRWVINNLMVKPITRYGQWLVGESRAYNLLDKIAKQFWFNIWRNI